MLRFRGILLLRCGGSRRDSPRIRLAQCLLHRVVRVPASTRDYDASTKIIPSKIASYIAGDDSVALGSVYRAIQRDATPYNAARSSICEIGSIRRIDERDETFISFRDLIANRVISRVMQQRRRCASHSISFHYIHLRTYIHS